MKKKKCYVLIISKQFPKTHPKSGQNTEFYEKIMLEEKKHTIRGNYELWVKRIDEINAGNAYLSVRCWSGKPYKSKQIELLEYTSLGFEKIRIVNHQNFMFTQIYNNNGEEKLQSDCISYGENKNEFFLESRIAKNDGLNIIDFKEWFFPKNKAGAKDGIIIHFTEFRYVK